MSTDDNDREIARLFETQRRADEASAPGFRDLLARPPVRKNSTPRRLVWSLAAAAAVILVAVFLHPDRGPSSQAPSASRTPVADFPQGAASLASWESPTDFLLRTPGSDLLSELPDLASPAPKTTQVSPTTERS